jgi:hypothetical protein
VKRVFKTDLSRSGITDLRKQLVDYKNNVLQQKVDLLAKRLAEKGVAIAQTNIATYDAIFTGELISSIEARYGGSTKGTAVFYVVADSRHAVFVEFGTGQLGLEGSYPYPFPEGVEWNYNTGKTIFEIENGQYGWFYPAEDGTWRFTQGMPSRPFMYETAVELMTEIAKTAKEVFG